MKTRLIQQIERLKRLHAAAPEVMKHLPNSGAIYNFIHQHRNETEIGGKF